MDELDKIGDNIKELTARIQKHDKQIAELQSAKSDLIMQLVEARVQLLQTAHLLINHDD